MKYVTKHTLATTLGLTIALAAPATSQEEPDGMFARVFWGGPYIQDQYGTCQDAWFKIGKALQDGKSVGHIKFDNAVDSMSSYGLLVDSGTNANKGHQIAVRTSTSVDNYAGQEGTATGQLAASGGYYARGSVRGVLGDADALSLSNYGAGGLSSGVGGWFVGGPAGAETLSLGTGSFFVGGVYGEARGDVVGGDSTSKVVAGVIGVDNTSSPGGGTSYAGWFDGDVLSTTGMFVASSRRLKENIHPIGKALDKVLRLQGVTYDLKSGHRDSMGFIAEDVGEIVPQVVRYEGNAQDAAAIDYARLTALLVEATKEQQVLIEDLQSRLASSR